MRCVKCGAELKPGAKFCGKCGAKVEEEPPVERPSVQPQTVPCPHCGAEMPVSAQFCGRCGKPMKEEAQPWEEERAEESYVSGQEAPDRPYEAPQPAPKKKKVWLWIVLGVVIVLVFIVGVVLLFFRSPDSQPQQEAAASAAVQEETSAQEDSELSSERQNLQESAAEEEAPEVSALPEESSAAPETTVTLSCGAVIDLEATSADLSGYEVTDLMGIERCTQLQNLKIVGGSLSDLTPLVGLSQLQALTLNQVPVADLTPLYNLTALSYLDITDTQVSASGVQAVQKEIPGLSVVGYTQSTYTVVANNCTWDEARALCEEAGGHLATVADSAEMDRILAALQNTTLTYLWLGGYSENEQWHWVTDEAWGGYANWYPGEPSKQDVDGTPENRLCLWNIDEKGWTMNDQRNDLSTFDHAQGRLGYICEIEQIAGFQE